MSRSVVKPDGPNEMQLPSSVASDGQHAGQGTRERLSTGSACGIRASSRPSSDGPREGIAPSYMTRVMQFTPLVPDIVEATLDTRQGPEGMLGRTLEPFPSDWDAQNQGRR